MRDFEFTISGTHNCWKWAVQDICSYNFIKVHIIQKLILRDLTMWHLLSLTQWGRDTFVSQTTLSNAFPWMKNARISFKISLKFVPKGSINNISALVQIMAWRRPGEKPLSETMIVCLKTHICVTRPQWVNSWVITILFCHYRIGTRK